MKLRSSKLIDRVPRVVECASFLLNSPTGFLVKLELLKADWGWSSAAMASVALPTRPRRRSRSEARPSTAPVIPHLSTTHAPTVGATRPSHSFSRPHPPKINIDTLTVHRSSPRRGSGNLALQARDSVTVRKRNMSTGAVSARAARQSARKANASLLQVSNTHSNTEYHQLIIIGQRQTRIPETFRRPPLIVAVNSPVRLLPRRRRVQIPIAIVPRVLLLPLRPLPPSLPLPSRLDSLPSPALLPHTTRGHMYRTTPRKPLHLRIRPRLRNRRARPRPPQPACCPHLHRPKSHPVRCHIHPHSISTQTT